MHLLSLMCFLHYLINYSRSNKSDDDTDLRQENALLCQENKSLHNQIQQLEKRNSILDQECQSKAKMCDQLMESVNRARVSLEEERKTNKKLDQVIKFVFIVCRNIRFT